MAKGTAATAVAADIPFRPVRGVRLYEIIVEQIAALVRDGHLVSGDRFPPERDLQARWRVSRPVLREAFRALEMQGLVESRPGGGRYLRAERIPSPAELKSPRLAADRQSLLHILEAREHLVLAHLAAGGPLLVLGGRGLPRHEPVHREGLELHRVRRRRPRRVHEGTGQSHVAVVVDAGLCDDEGLIHLTHLTPSCSTCEHSTCSASTSGISRS